jgi:hypothetical protein
VTNLLVLEAQQQDLLHHGQLGLLAALGALTDVSRVVGDLVAVLAALVARLGGAVPHIVGRVGPGGRCGLAISIQAAPASPTTSRQP